MLSRRDGRIQCQPARPPDISRGRQSQGARDRDRQDILLSNVYNDVCLICSGGAYTTPSGPSLNSRPGMTTDRQTYREVVSRKELEIGIVKTLDLLAPKNPKTGILRSEQVECLDDPDLELLATDDLAICLAVEQVDIVQRRTRRGRVRPAGTDQADIVVHVGEQEHLSIRRVLGFFGASRSSVLTIPISSSLRLTTSRYVWRSSRFQGANSKTDQKGSCTPRRNRSSRHRCTRWRARTLFAACETSKTTLYLCTCG
jgi:hypothetical protein